jgi:glycosyltransferase involved in cell wall biosynthesis
MESSGLQQLGIAIISYNRLTALQGGVEAVQRCTTMPYQLVIADDGSDDGSVAWAREQGLRVITGQHRGTAWNRNRAIYHLLERSTCDPILLLDDDCWPDVAGWEHAWVAAATRWGHVCLTFLGPKPDPSGLGTPEDPYRGLYFGGPCTATTRAALSRVGYFDTRFLGHGWEDIDWSLRFGRLFESEWGPPPHTCPSMVAGLRFLDFGSHHNPEDHARNDKLLQALRQEPIWRPPWRTPEEEEVVRAEQAAAEQASRVDLSDGHG